MRVQDLLRKHGSRQALTEALKALLDDDTRLELDEAGLRALTSELQSLQGSTSSQALENLKTAELLLKAAFEGVDLSDDRRLALLGPAYPSALVGLLQASTRAVAGGQRLSPAQADSLETVLSSLAELAETTAAAAGGGKPLRGRDLHGRQVIPALLSLLVAPDASGDLLPLKRAASTAMLDYLLNSKANCVALAELPDSAAPLFGSVLPSCGDVIVQVDLIEALYRCARVGALRPEHRSALRPDLLAAMEALVGRTGPKGRSLDLPGELRKLLVPFNRGLGAEATVFSVQAKSLSISGIDGVAGPGKWVDFGLRSFTVGLSLPEPEEEQEEEEDPPEMVIFPYADVLRVHASPGATAGYTKVHVTPRELPLALQAMSQEFKGKASLIMQFSSGDLSTLASHAPRVAAAMRTAGLSFVGAEGAVSGGGMDLSQRGRKCSTGLTIYDATKAGPGGPTGSSGRAPLPLTRSGHKPGGPTPAASNQTGQTASGAGRPPLHPQQQQQQQPQPQASGKRPLSLLRRASSPAPLPGYEATLAPPAGQPSLAEPVLAAAAVAANGAAEPASSGAPASGEADVERPSAVQPTAEPTASEEAEVQRRGRSQGGRSQGGRSQGGRSQQQQQQQQQAQQRRSQLPEATGGTRTTQTAAQAAHLADGEVNSPELLPAVPAPAPAAAADAAQVAGAGARAGSAGKAGAAGRAGSAGKAGAAGKAAGAQPSEHDDEEWTSEEEGEEEEQRRQEEQAADKGKGKGKGKGKKAMPALAESPAAAAKQRSHQAQQVSPAAAAKQRAQQRAQQRPGTSKEGGGQQAGGRKKAGLAAMKKGGKAAAPAKQAKRGKGPSPDDPIEETAPEAGAVAGAEGSDRDSPEPSWMKEEEKKAKQAAAAEPSKHDSDSDSELRHDHASRQPLFKRNQQQHAAAAAAAKEAKAASAAAAAKGKGKGKAAPGSEGGKAAAAAVKRAARAAADAEEEEGEEEEESEGEEAREAQVQRQGEGKHKGGAKKQAAAAPKAAPAALKKKQAGAGAAKKAGAGGPKAAGVGKRPRHAAGAGAAAKNTKPPATEEEEQEQGGAAGEDEFHFDEASPQARKPAVAAKGRAGAGAGAGRPKQMRSPLAAMKVIGKKRLREAQAVAEEETDAEEEAFGAGAGAVPVHNFEEELPQGGDIPEVDLVAVPSGSEPAGAAALPASEEQEVAGVQASPMPAEEEGQEEGSEQEEEEEAEAEEAGNEAAPAGQAALQGFMGDADADDEQEAEEGEEDSEEEAAAAAGYRSQGTRHLQGWTNFRPPEAVAPDMLVEEDELRHITKRFKFTAVKEPPAARTTAAAAAAAWPGPSGATGARRSKAELKAEAAAGGAGRKGPTPLLGLTAAKPTHLTTTLSQEGLAPVGAAAAAARRGTATTAATKANGKQQQQQQQQQQQLQPPQQKKAAAPATAAAKAAAAGGGKGAAPAAGKRALESLGHLSAGKQKRPRAAAVDAAGTAAGGGRAPGGGARGGARQAPGTAAAAAAAAGQPADDSQPALSIHHLLQSVTRRHANATPNEESDSEDDEDSDMAAVQAVLVELMRKKKAGAAKKQVEMVDALEREISAAVDAQQKEAAAASQKLNSQAMQRFAALEKQLDAKMREIDSSALAFQQQLNTLWEEYRKMYDKVSSAAAEMEEVASKQRGAQARSVEALRDSLAAKAAEVAAKIERSSRKAGKMPELAQVLLPFLD